MSTSENAPGMLGASKREQPINPFGGSPFIIDN
jgi:hypothetical protein